MTLQVGTTKVHDSLANNDKRIRRTKEELQILYQIKVLKNKQPQGF